MRCTQRLGPGAGAVPRRPARHRLPGDAGSATWRSAGSSSTPADAGSPAGRARRHDLRPPHRLPRRPAARPDRPLPADLDPLLGVYVAHMGPICANGLLHAAADAVRRRRAHARRRGRAAGGWPSSAAASSGCSPGCSPAGTAPRRSSCSTRRRGAAPPRRASGSTRSTRTPPTRPCVLKRRWRHGPGDRGADVVFQCRGRSGRARAGAAPAAPAGHGDRPGLLHRAAAPRCGSARSSTTTGWRVRCAQIGRVPPRHRRTCGTASGSRPRRSRCCSPTATAVREHVITDVLPLDGGTRAPRRPRRPPSARHPGGAHRRHLSRANPSTTNLW